MKFEEHQLVCTLRPEGDLSGPEADALSRAAAAQRATDLVVDLEAVSSVDSAGLEALLQIARQCTARRGKLRLAQVGPGIREILRITRLENRLELQPSAASIAPPQPEAA